MVKHHFFKNYDQLSDKEVFSIIVQLFNKIENKQTDGDSLRKWVQQMMDKIIQLLNGGPGSSNFDRESLKVLIQLYYT